MKPTSSATDYEGAWTTRQLLAIIAGRAVSSSAHSSRKKTSMFWMEAVRRIVLDPGSMRALGFCVSKEHARYMARKFTEAGLESVALTGDDAPAERDRQLQALRAGRLRCVFSVEVLGEGVDAPDVDCLLLLRPTSSSTVFTQQLGRGLRRAAGKSHLTVIDLIGQHRREFRFEDRLRAILDTKRGTVVKQVEEDFPFLPADLDRQSRESVIDNLKAAVRRSRWATLVQGLRTERDEITLSEFLERHDHRLEDVYRPGSWAALRRDAGRTTATASDAELEGKTLKAIGRLTHLDDPERVTFYLDVLSASAPPTEAAFDGRRRRLLTMLAGGLGRVRAGTHRSTRSSTGCGARRLYASSCASCSG